LLSQGFLDVDMILLEGKL